MKNNVAYFRNLYGLTQEDLAKDCNVRRETIIRIENGLNVPSIKLALKIQYVLGEPMHKLFWLSESEKP